MISSAFSELLWETRAIPEFDWTVFDGSRFHWLVKESKHRIAFARLPDWFSKTKTKPMNCVWFSSHFWLVGHGFARVPDWLCDCFRFGFRQSFENGSKVSKYLRDMASFIKSRWRAFNSSKPHNPYVVLEVYKHRFGWTTRCSEGIDMRQVFRC